MKARYYIAIILYCAFIFWMSSQTSPPGSQIRFPGADKVAHFGVYGILAALISVGLHRSPRPVAPVLRHYLPVAFAMLYGLSDEIHQLFTPGRTYSLLDLLADGIGATVAQLLCLGYFEWMPRRRKENAVHGTE